MPDIFQHAIVSLIALLAAWVVVRRVVGTFGPSSRERPACPSCASGCAHTTRTAQRQGR